MTVPQTNVPPIYVWDDLLRRHEIARERVSRELRLLNSALVKLNHIEQERDAFIAQHQELADA